LKISGLKGVRELERKLPALVARERKAPAMLILLILLIVLLIGATPAWPYSRGWGYYPSGVLGTILVIFLVLLLLGQVNL
jgi:Protein of unknown function (DUF3309)